MNMNVERFVIQSIIQLGVFGIISVIESLLFGISYINNMTTAIPMIMALCSATLSSSIVMFIEARLEQNPTINKLKEEFDVPGMIFYIMNITGFVICLLELSINHFGYTEIFICGMFTMLVLAIIKKFYSDLLDH